MLCQDRKSAGQGMSWQIFIHSVRQVFGNLDGALRVSGVLTLVQVLVMLGISPVMFRDQAAIRQMIESGQISAWQAVAAGLLQVVLWLWIVVGWHRYILLNEKPRLVPLFRADRILGYFGKSLLIGLILVIPAMVLAMIVGVLAASMVKGGMNTNLALILLVLLVYLPLGTVATRLAAVLPGVALEPGVPLFTGWQATRGHTGAVLGVVFLTMLGSLALQYIGGWLFAAGGLTLALAVAVITTWLQAMVGASILTTLYGHYVEKRPLV